MILCAAPCSLEIRASIRTPCTTSAASDFSRQAVGDRRRDDPILRTAGRRTQQGQLFEKKPSERRRLLMHVDAAEEESGGTQHENPEIKIAQALSRIEFIAYLCTRKGFPRHRRLREGRRGNAVRFCDNTRCCEFRPARALKDSALFATGRKTGKARN